MEKASLIEFKKSLLASLGLSPGLKSTLKLKLD